LAIAAVGTGLILAIVMLIQDRCSQARELLRMEKVRGSKMYQEIYPLVVKCRARPVDQVRIERNRILFTSMSPPGVICSFSPTDKGYRILSIDNTRALAEVMAEDMDILKDKDKYRFTRYRIIRPNGNMDYGYLYTMRSAYKDRLMATPRYSGLKIM